jgi:type I restriction enzyme, S subunit
MIPKNWDFIPLEQLALVERGKFTARPRNDPRYYGGSIPFVQTGDVASSNGLIQNYSQTLNQEGLGVSKLFPRGSILVTIAAIIGEVAITCIDVACPDSIVVVQAKSGVCREWLKYALLSRKPAMEAFATQNAQKNINLQVLRPLLIPTPPKEEQYKIAEILATWDEAIALTEKLITAKKKHRNLLESILFNQSNQLQEFKLSEIIEIKHGYAFSSDYFSEHETEKILLTPGNFHVDGHLYFGNNTKYYIGVTNDEFHLRNGDLLIVMTDLTKEMNILGNAVILESPKIVLHNQRIGKIIIKNDSIIVKNYLCHLLNSKSCNKYIKETATGSTVRHTSSKEILKIKVSIPSIKMQKFISSVLDTADYEIQRLNRYCDLLKTQKRGLMQKLLTGEWRVKIEETATQLTEVK